MKISTKGRYALEAVLDLAVFAKAAHESLKNIAQRRSISENYLEQIFVLLRRKGIVTSIRGAQGGYKLAKAASEITAGEIIRAVEGELAPVICIVEHAHKEKCQRHDTCVTRILWGKIMDEINDTADAVSVSDLMAFYEKMNVQQAIEYFI